jgi:outer membrane protein
MHRKRVTALLFLAAAMAAPSALIAQQTVGIIDVRQALEGTAEIKKKAEQMQATFQPRYDELNKLSQELEEIQKKLQTATGDDGLQLQTEGQRKQREAQRLQEDLQTDTDYERNEILQAANQRLRAIVNQVAQEKGLDLVVDISSTIYFSPALDFTNEVVAAYDKAHPVSP